MKKRLFLLSLILCLSLGSITGCGKTTVDPDTTTVGPVAQAPDISETLTEAETTSPSDTDDPEDTASPDTDDPENTTSPDTDDPEDTASPNTDDPEDTASPDTDNPEDTTAPSDTSTDTSATTVNTSTLVVGINAEFPPFEYDNSGTLTGIDVDIITAVAANLGKTVEFRNMEYASLLPALQNGEVDMAISTITVTENRSSYAAFSNPYLTYSLTILVKNTSPVTVAENLPTVTVGVVDGSPADLYYSAEHPDAKIQRFATAKKLFQAVKKGTVDCALLEDSQAQALIEGKAKFSTIPYLTEEYVVALPLNNSGMLAQVNAAISALQASGSIDTITTQYLGK